jgi:hypothetical protein
LQKAGGVNQNHEAGILKTYTLEGSLSSGLSLLGTLGRLGGTACNREKDASAIALFTELAKSAAALDASIVVSTGRRAQVIHPGRKLGTS